MLSICIPVYNYDVSKLLSQLDKQCSVLNIQYEILVFEDGSDSNKVNSLENYKNVKHIVRKDNSGRSKARNILADNARFDKLLFLDCDSETGADDFIKNYIDNSEKTVVCGGTIYKESQYKKEFSLRYWYGIKREMISGDLRNSNVNQSFTTNNFLISRSVFEKIKFREFLTKYGHEDSLFGYELKHSGINILHIDNPVVHVGLESNQVFLDKTKNAIDNLIVIEKSKLVDTGFTAEISLVRAYKKLKRTGLKGLVKLFFSTFEKTIVKNLLYSTKPSMFLFDVYKLAYYCKKKDHEKEKN